MVLKRYRNIFILISFLLFSSVAMTGCVYVIVGGLAALGGYAISPDTVEGETQIDYDTLWDTTIEIVSVMGNIQSQDYKIGQIEAVVNGAHVWIDLSQMSSSWVRMRVKARKNMLPHIKTAQNVWIKIKTRVTE